MNSKRKINLKIKHKRICKKVDEFYDTQIDLEFVHNELIDLEDRARRNNATT